MKISQNLKHFCSQEFWIRQTHSKLKKKPHMIVPILQRRRKDPEKSHHRYGRVRHSRAVTSSLRRKCGQ